MLRAVNETLRLPRGRDLDVLLDYVAFLSVNNPARRGAMNDAQARMLFFMAQMMVARPETFEAAQAECRRDGVPLLADVGYDELRAALENGSFGYDMPTIAHVRGMGHAVDHLAALLRQRTWSLLIATPGAPDFVCSEHPVPLTWTVERGRELLVAGVEWPNSFPGFGMSDSEVVVPLGCRVALVGVFGGTARRIAADARTVAEMDRRMLGQATRYPYSAEPTFTFWDAQQNFRELSALVDVDQDDESVR